MYPRHRRGAERRTTKRADEGVSVSAPQDAEFVEYFNQHTAEPIDYDRLCKFLASQGVAGLKNGLSTEDNEMLFQTSQVTLMIYLVLKGLANLASES